MDDATYIFVPDIDERKKLWEGEYISEDEIRSKNPSAQIVNISQREDMIKWLYTITEKVETNLDYLNYPADHEKQLLQNLLSIPWSDIIPLDHSYRAIKSSEEIVKIRKAQQITQQAIDYALQDLVPGMFEYEIAAKLSYFYARLGYTDAFAPIVASGRHACTLHYTANKSQIQQWDVLLIDTWAYVDGYCGDCSRSIIVAERSDDKKKKQILSIVQYVHDACITFVKPWVSIKQLHEYAIQKFEKKIIWLRLQGTISDYFPHSIGHSIGLDVHDPLYKDRILDKGICITIEPGLYIPERDIGVRIEDIVVITESGCEVL